MNFEGVSYLSNPHRMVGVFESNFRDNKARGRHQQVRRRLIMTRT